MFLSILVVLKLTGIILKYLFHRLTMYFLLGILFEIFGLLNCFVKNID